MIKKTVILFSILIFSLSNSAWSITEDKSVQDFIDYMVSNHQFDKNELVSLFEKAQKSDRILAAISKPAEALPWYKYRQIFIQSKRINDGVKFWEQHETVLQKAEQEFGISPEVIIAIIGVETLYGANTGNDRVVDALSTLAFYYPKRADFFRSELEQFLLLSREQKLDPLSLNGSYAGAMGIPQFIPSSYRSYAVDFDGDGKTNIWTDPIDAIGSVANYFKVHGWKHGEKVVVRATNTGGEYSELLNTDLTPSITVKELRQHEIIPRENIPPDEMVKLLSLENESDNELWLGLNNFYVITRYNRSPLYAMAVYQLSELIRAEKEKLEDALGR